MPGSNSSNGSGPPLTRIHLDLIDIVFGVIVGVSFTDFRELLVPFSIKFETFTLFLAYVTVIGSWIGYHRAINKETDEKPDDSVVRLIIDLVILYLYFYLIYSINNFLTVLMVLPTIFGCYLLWAIARDYEFNKKFKEKGEKIRGKAGSTLGKSSSKKNAIFLFFS
jgi:Na+/H+ antiporter NhaD/arsenite permease-like protein